jgi:Zn ribbon nucleic-acid-binding protein
MVAVLYDGEGIAAMEVVRCGHCEHESERERERMEMHRGSSDASLFSHLWPD